MGKILVSLVTIALAACDEPPPPPQPVTVTVAVGGMHCAGCAMAITEALEKLDGVKGCDTSFADKRAEVVLDPARVTPAEVASVIAGLGYHASMPGETAPPRPPAATEPGATPVAIPAEAAQPAPDEAAPLPDADAPPPTAPATP